MVDPKQPLGALSELVAGLFIGLTLREGLHG